MLPHPTTIIIIAAYSLTPAGVDSCSSVDSVAANDLSIGSGSTITDTTNIDTDANADTFHVYYFGLYNDRLIQVCY